jgi:hypothetical protein
MAARADGDATMTPPSFAAQSGTVRQAGLRPAPAPRPFSLHFLL